MIPREALVQAIDYASDIASWDIDRFREICKTFTKKDLEDFLQEKFEGIEIEDLVINQTQKILLVGFSAEESLNRMVEWLSNSYSLGLNVIMLNYVQTSNGDEILSRTVMIP